MSVERSISYKLEFRNGCEFCGSSDYTLLGRRLNQSQGRSPKRKSGITVSIAKCNNCDLIYSNPLPIPHNIQDHYNVDPSQYWKEGYFEHVPTYFKRELEVYDQLNQADGLSTALDIGVGIGKCMVALKKHGMEVHGIEPSEAFFDMAKKNPALKDASLHNCAIEEFDFENNYFDFVTFGAVLEHLYHPKEAMAKALSVLKPGGLLHIEVPNSRWLVAELINLFYKLTGSDFVTNLSPMHSPFHLYEFSVRSFEKIADELGFEIAFQEHFVCQIEGPKILHGVLRKMMQKRDKGMQLSIWLRKK